MPPIPPSTPPPPAAPPRRGAASGLTVLRGQGGYCLARFRCAAEGPHGGEETSCRHEVVLVRDGVFVRTSAAGRVVADPNQLLFFHRDEPYRVEHPAGGDDCLIVSLPEDDLLALVDDVAGVVDPSRPFPHPAAPCPAAVALRVQRLLRHQPPPEGADLELEEELPAVVAAAVGAGGESRRTPEPVRGATRRRWREQVERVQVLLGAALDERHSLAGLARQVHASPWQLARVFRRQTGESIHRYLMRLRLLSSLQRLAEGAEDLTALALELGFADHAHFTRSFRGVFGTTPSAVRWAGGSRLRALRRRASLGMPR
jgi:AraC family transcriptional regulator